MSQDSGTESDQKDLTKSKNEAAFNKGVGNVTIQHLHMEGGSFDNREIIYAQKAAYKGGNFTINDHGSRDMFAVQTPSGNTSAEGTAPAITGARGERKEEPSTSDSQTYERKSKIPRLDEGIVQISDDMFINTKKPLKKGKRIYEGYQQHVGGHRLLRAIKAIAPFSKESIREVNYLVKLVSHPNVVQIIKSKEQHTQDSLPTLYIVMELCSPLTLHDYLKEKRERNSPFDFKKAMSFSKELIRGMKHIHDNRIIHGDLKPQNIVFSLKGDQIKVTDFGISKQLQESCSVTDMTGEGTDGYRAPETYISRRTSLMADIYSLGITLYSIFTNGKHPFGEVKQLWSYHIMENKGLDLSGLPEEIVHERDEFLNLLGNMLEFDPKKRPTMKEISDHAFFSDNQASTAQDYHCPEEPSFDIAEVDRLLEHVNKIQPRDEAAAKKIHQRVADAGLSKKGDQASHVPELDMTSGVTNVIVRGSTENVYNAHLRDETIYYIDPRRRKGRVLIINNDFQGTSEFREGSEVDVRNMKVLWTALGFEVVTKINLTAEQMRDSCRTFAAESIDISVVVVIIMSHFKENHNGKEYFLGQDEGMLAAEDVIAMFTSNESPQLRGIPKLLFFQVRRGETVGLHGKGPDARVDARVAAHDDVRGDTRGIREPYSPLRTDMLITYLTPVGYVAIRNARHGSWLTNAVTNIFMQHAHDTHVLDMLIMVNDAVSRRISGNLKIQICNLETCLKKKLFLYPGWPMR